MDEYTASVVQVHHREPDGRLRLLGAGFVVADGTLVVTCRHVLEPQSPPLAFEAAAAYEISLRTGESCPVLRVGNAPSASALDIAFLRLNAALGVPPLPLTTIEGFDPKRVLNSYGFPNIDGTRAHAEVRILGRAPAEQRVPEMEGDISKDLIFQAYSEQLTNGFSGAPIWDPARKAVVAVAQSVIAPDATGQLGHTAYIVPADLLPKIFDELKLRDDALPYMGLRAFSEHESHLFRGRDDDLRRLIENIRIFPRLLVLSGPSGSGKSSLVRAGVVATLRAASGDPVLSRIYPIVVLPRDESGGNDLRLGTSAESIASVVKDQLPLLKRDWLLLIVDQSERLFTSEDNLKFLAELNGVIQSTDPVTVVFVVRKDFQDRLIDAVGVRSEGSRCIQELPGKMSRDQLREIIAEPALATGWPWPEDFVYLMIAACGAFRTRERVRAAAEATVLPLLQFTLSEIWRRRAVDPDRPTSEYYEELGGLTGSISENATRYYNNLGTEEQRRIIRSILLDLINVTVEQTAQVIVTRRSSIVSRLRAVADDATRDTANRLIDELVDQHLLTATGLGYERVVEIVHDSLAANWDLLYKWVSEAAEQLAFRQDVESARRKWEVSGKRPRLLASGAMMREAFDSALHRSEWLNRDDKKYLAISRRRSRRWLPLIPVVLVALVLAPVLSYWHPGIVPVLPFVSRVYPQLDWVAPFISNDEAIDRSAHNSALRLTDALLVETQWAGDPKRSCEDSPWRFYRYSAPLNDRCQLSVWDTSQAAFALAMSFEADDSQLRVDLLDVLAQSLVPTHLVHPAGPRVGWPTSRDSGPPASPLPAKSRNGEEIAITVRGGALMSYTDASPTFWSSLALGAIQSYRPNLLKTRGNNALADAIRGAAATTNSLASRFRLEDQHGGYVHVLYELDERGNNRKNLSTYASTIAFLAALHNLDACTGIALPQYPSAQADVIASTRFFERWAPSANWGMTEQMQGSGHPEALSYQIATAMLLADRSTLFTLDSRTEDVIHNLLARSFAYHLGSRPTGDELDSYSATTRQSHITSTDGTADENTTFTWFPWALASAALYYDRQHRLHRSEQNINEARRFLARLMKLSDTATSIALRDRTFQKAELLYALTVVEGVTGYYHGRIASPFGLRDGQCGASPRLHPM